MTRPDIASATSQKSENPISVDILKQGRIKRGLREADSIIRDIDLLHKLCLNELEKELLRGLMAYEWLRKSSFESDRMLQNPQMEIGAGRFAFLRIFYQKALAKVEADRRQEADLLAYLTASFNHLPSFSILQRLSNMLLAQVFKQHRAFDRVALDVIATRFQKELDQKRIAQVDRQLSHANGQNEN